MKYLINKTNMVCITRIDWQGDVPMLTIVAATLADDISGYDKDQFTFLKIDDKVSRDVCNYKTIINGKIFNK